MTKEIDCHRKVKVSSKLQFVFYRATWICGLIFVIAGAIDPCRASGLPSPEGLWLTFDQSSGLPRSHIRLEIVNGSLRGRIDRILLPSEMAYPRCNWCSGSFKDAPFLGMIILKDLKPSSNDHRRWEYGRVLDPDTGQEYDARLILNSSGDRLELRGFARHEAFGKSQIWNRISAQKGDSLK